MTIEETRLILAMLQQEARLQKPWKVTYMTKLGRRKRIEQWLGCKIVHAQNRDEAILKADIWNPLIIKVEQI